MGRRSVVSDYLFDTDTFSHYLQDHQAVLARVVRNISSHLFLSIISVEETWDGWQAVLRRAKSPAQMSAAYDRLTEVMQELRRWPIVSFDAMAIGRYELLKKAKLNVGGNDLKIGAIALERNATVVTCNRRDFARIPGVVTEDWTL